MEKVEDIKMVIMKDQNSLRQLKVLLNKGYQVKDEYMSEEKDISVRVYILAKYEKETEEDDNEEDNNFFRN